VRQLVVSLLLLVGMLATGTAAAHADEPAPDPVVSETDTSPEPNDEGIAPDPLDVADAAAPMSAFTTAGVDDPQCMGAQFVPNQTDVAVAKKLLQGYVTIPTFKQWRIPVTSAGKVDLVRLTWAENPYKNNNWVFNMNTLRWLDPLRRAAQDPEAEISADERDAMLDLYEDLIHDWVSNNPFSTPRSAYAWNDMAVGVRSIELVCASTVIDENAPDNLWLKKAIQAHAKSLMDPKQYRVVGNHALHQNMGLLALGCHTDTAAWKDLAVTRGTTLLKRSVDSQGVSDEGSILYQELNHRWYSELKKRLEICGIVPDPHFGNLDLMPNMLAQATQPDGTVVAWGDTSAKQRARNVPGTVAEYAATLGKTGPKPTTPLFSVFRRGYAYSRTGWFDTQGPNTQSLAAIRFGPGKTHSVHGHEDSGNISYFALGKQILWQPGVWGGAGGKPRGYVVSNQAHNTVDIPDGSYDPSADTRLSVTRTSTAADLVSIRSTSLRGAVWKRTMIHAKQANFLVVDDYVTQTKSRTVVQRWNFGSDRTVRTGQGRVVTSGSGSNSVTLWVGSTPKLSVVKGQSSPMLGWRSETVNTFIKTPVAQASIKGKTVRMTAIIVPRPGSMSVHDIRVIRSSTSGGKRIVYVGIGKKTYRLEFNSSFAQVTLR
jgi:hypothetical protein